MSRNHRCDGVDDDWPGRDLCGHCDLAFGKGTVAPIMDPGGIEMIGNNLIVVKFEQLVDP
jgi:hypothetical protein